MSEPNLSISRLNQLYSALGIQLKELVDQYSMMIRGKPDPIALRVGNHPDSKAAIRAILTIREDILEMRRKITHFQLSQQDELETRARANPIHIVAKIAAEFDLNGYIEEHALEFADKDALYSVYHDTETEDGEWLSRSIIRDRVSFDVAMSLGQTMAGALGLKPSLIYGTWMTCVPCEIEETIVVEKSQ